MVRANSLAIMALTLLLAATAASGRKMMQNDAQASAAPAADTPPASDYDCTAGRRIANKGPNGQTIYTSSLKCVPNANRRRRLAQAAPAAQADKASAFQAFVSNVQAAPAAVTAPGATAATATTATATTATADQAAAAQAADAATAAQTAQQQQPAAAQQAATATDAQAATTAPAGTSTESAAATGSSGGCMGTLSAQNAMRTKHGAAPFTWSADLQARAQQWANTCANRHQSPPGLGENIAWGGGTTCDSAMSIFLAEEKLYRRGGGYQEDASHWSQIVWKGSGGVGCADAVCGGQGFMVCYYEPPGNYIDQMDLQIA